MRFFWRLLCPFVVVLTIPVVELHAQLPHTRLSSIFPAGAQQGTSAEITISGGKDLDEVNALIFSQPGITAVAKTKDENGKQIPIPQQFVVTVAADVQPGVYDVRAVGLFGVSNPRSFVVGNLAEVRETEANNTPETANTIQYDQCINGQMAAATDIDFFKFNGKKGERLITTCQAARIDSPLLCVLELYSPAGKQLAYSRNQVRSDPLLDAVLPEDGEYLIKLYDFTYTGSADHFYRMQVSTRPHVDFVFPPFLQAGETAPRAVYGRNLPNGTATDFTIDGQPLEKIDVEITAPSSAEHDTRFSHRLAVEAGQSFFTFQLPGTGNRSASTRLSYATQVIVSEVEPNDQPTEVQKLAIPCQFVGQFQNADDTDQIEFEAKAQETFVIDVIGQRLGSDVDPMFVLQQITKDDKGVETVKDLTTIDDNEQNLAANIFDTRTDDPSHTFQVPADGTYRLLIRDRYFESRGSPNMVYSVVIRRPTPDFELLAVPFLQAPGQVIVNTAWSVGLRKGGQGLLRVYANRVDGFNAPIHVMAENLPAGVTCQPAIIDASQNITHLVFTAAEDAALWNGPIRVVGKTQIAAPDKKAAAEAAKANVAASQKLVQALQQSAEQTTTAIQTAVAQLPTLRELLKGDTGNDELIKQITALEGSLKQLGDQLQQTSQTQKAAEQVLTASLTALQNAENDGSTSTRWITHSATPGTLVQDSAANIPALSRVAQSLDLAILKEVAPFQATVGQTEIIVRPGSQLLIPVALKKRTGFDDAVTLTHQQLPANVDAGNPAIPKGADQQTQRLFFKENVAPGTYTTWIQTDATVPYRRNIFLLNDTNAALATTNQALAAAQKMAEAQKAKYDAAQAAFVAAEQKFKNAQAALQATDKKTADALAAVNTAKQLKEEMNKKSVAEIRQSAKQASEQLAALEKQLQANTTNGDAEIASLQASIKEISEALGNRRAAIDKNRSEASLALKSVDEALAKLQSEQAEQKAVVVKAQEVFDARQKEKQQAEDENTQATTAVTTATAEVEAAKKQVAEIEKATAAVATKYFPPSSPLTIRVLPAPVSITAKAASGDNIKQGATIDVVVTIKRVNDFTGPVTLTIPELPGVTGISAQPVTIAAEQTTATLTIAAAKEAAVGEIPNFVVRGVSEFNGKAIVDFPLKLTVAQ